MVKMRQLYLYHCICVSQIVPCVIELAEGVIKECSLVMLLEAKRICDKDVVTNNNNSKPKLQRLFISHNC